MTAETSRYRQLSPFKRSVQPGRGGRTSRRIPALPESSVFRELREFLTSSPGKLVSLALVLIIMSLFVGWFTSAAQLTRTDVLRSNLIDFEPRANAAQVLYSSLSAANESANAAFVAGGLPSQDIDANYRTSIARAGKSLITSATSLPTDENRARANLDSIAMYLPVYTGLVDTARANNRQHNSVAAAYLATASDLMQNTLLPAAESFYNEETAGLRGTHRQFANPPWAVYAALAVAVASILVAHEHLYFRTRRRLNLGLLVAGGTMSLALVWVLITGLISVTFSSTAAQQGSSAVDQLTQARILAQKARSMETMSLVQHGTGRSLPPDAFADTLGDARAILADTDSRNEAVTRAVQAARSAADRWADAHREIIARETQGDYVGATAFAIGSDPASAASAFQTLDGELSKAIGQARTVYRDNVNTAQTSIAFSGPGVFLLCLIAAAGVGAGFYPRIREYR